MKRKDLRTLSKSLTYVLSIRHDICSYITCCTRVISNRNTSGGEGAEEGSIYSPGRRFSLFASNATLAEIQYYVPSRASILIGDIWRERRNRSYPVFLSGRPPFEGILFRRGSTNITRAPSWAFNGSTVCIPARRVSTDTLFSSCNRVALRRSIPPSLPLLRELCVSARIFAIRLANRFIARSLRARRRRGWRIVSDIRRLMNVENELKRHVSLPGFLKRI